MLESSGLPDALAALRQAVYEQEMRGPAPSPFIKSPATMRVTDEGKGIRTGVIIMNDTVRRDKKYYYASSDGSTHSHFLTCDEQTPNALQH